MASFIIEGGHRLHGELIPQGAKNEALEVLCATLLTPEEVKIYNIPDILDVNNLIQLLRDLGVTVERIGLNAYSFKADKINLDYLDSDEFVDAMRQDGYIFNKQENGYKFFTSSDGKCVVRSANLAPYPTIEYLEPESLEL